MADTPYGEDGRNPAPEQNNRAAGEQGSWDAFDWASWGDDADQANASPEGQYDDERARDGQVRRPPGRPGMLRPALEELGDEEIATLSGADEQGRWVSRGGVMQWEEPDTRDATEFPNLRDEAYSHWAANEITLPLGAPERMRVRAMRAWLARRRMLETEAQGTLLLERRRLLGGTEGEDGDADDPDATVFAARRRRAIREEHPLDLAIAERQASADEYEDALLMLEELRAHSGVDRILIELYLALTDRLAALAAAPAASQTLADTNNATTTSDEAALTPLDRAVLLALAPEGRSALTVGETPTPRDVREWLGRAQAVLQTRRHIERLTAPEPEE